MVRNRISFLRLAVVIFTLVLSGRAHSLDSLDYVGIAKSSLAEMDEADVDETVRVQFSDMVDFSTLTLMDVNNGQALLSFTPVLVGLEKEKDKLSGTLRMNADTLVIEELNLVNTGKISPAFSVSLTSFNMNLSFSPFDGEMLLARMASTIEGKAGFLKKFKSDSEIIFSDYRRIPGSQRISDLSP